jgi:hypothetical protein
MKPNQTYPTVAEMLGECVSLTCVVALYGPPVIFLAAPWLLLGLILSGPFAVVLTLLAAVLVAAALVAAIGALVATPFLLIRRQRAAHVPVAAPAAVFMPIDRRLVAA